MESMPVKQDEAAIDELKTILDVLIESKPVKQDVETIDDIETIFDEMGKIYDELYHQTAIDIVQELLDVPINIEQDYVEVKGEEDIISIGKQEFTPYISKKIYINFCCLVKEGNYIRYSCKYSEESDNGSIKLLHITVFVKVEDNGELCSPLHLYAYKRICEKPAGMLEPYTEPEWDISYTSVE